MRICILITLLSVGLILNAIPEQDLALYFTTKKSSVVGLTGTPYPAYSSDSGAGAGLQIILFDASHDSLRHDPFDLKFDASFTTNGERSFELDYLKEYTEKEWKFAAQLEYKIMPFDFWGIGGNTSLAEKESYTQNKQIASFLLQKAFSADLFFGPIIHYNSFQYDDREENDMFANTIAGSEDSFSIFGTGFVFDYNKTDIKHYPTKGYRFINESVLYKSVNTKDYFFYSGVFDFRTYYPIFEKHVLCAQVLSQNTSDNPPFQLMPKQGGHSIMRGYPNGRFIDRQFIATQIEYRSPIRMKLGLVLYTSLGNSYHNFSDFKASNTHLSYGTGFRLNISKAKMLNMRGDIAFSKEGRSIYFKVGESF